MGIQESTLNSWISCLSLCGAWGNYLGYIVNVHIINIFEVQG